MSHDRDKRHQESKLARFPVKQQAQDHPFTREPNPKESGLAIYPNFRERMVMLDFRQQVTSIGVTYDQAEQIAKGLLRSAEMIREQIFGKQGYTCSVCQPEVREQAKEMKWCSVHGAQLHAKDQEPKGAA